MVQQPKTEAKVAVYFSVWFLSPSVNIILMLAPHHDDGVMSVSEAREVSGLCRRRTFSGFLVAQCSRLCQGLPGSVICAPRYLRLTELRAATLKSRFNLHKYFLNYGNYH